MHCLWHNYTNINTRELPWCQRFTGGTTGFLTATCGAPSDDKAGTMTLPHDDVIKWKHFPSYWPFVRGIHRSPLNSPHKGQWRGALMFSLIVRKYSNSQKHIHRHDMHGFGFGYIRVLNGYWFILHIHQGCYMYPDTKSIFGNTSQVTMIVMGGLTDTKPK